MFKDKKDKQEEFLKTFKDIRKENITVFPVGMDPDGRSRAYIVRGDRI